MFKLEQTPDHSRNADRVRGDDRLPCYICGRAINTTKKNFYWLTVGGGGFDALLPAEVDANDAGFMGLQPIGADCLKNQPGLRPYATRNGAQQQERG